MTYKLGFLVFEYLIWSEVGLFIARMFYCILPKIKISRNINLKVFVMCSVLGVVIFPVWHNVGHPTIPRFHYI